jgi:hypothetical protein
MQKTCTRCRQIKPLNEFKKDRRLLDGHTPQCKECAREADKEYRSRPEVQGRDSERAGRYKNPRIFKEQNPAATKAHAQVNNAIRAGKLPKASEFACRNCGNAATEYHHHNGYEAGHEFDVIPLCRSCHRLIHNA